MRCELVRTSAGTLLRDVETGRWVYGPEHSLGKLSNFTRDNRIVITNRREATEEEVATIAQPVDAAQTRRSGPAE